jgi:hypothetical protein
LNVPSSEILNEDQETLRVNQGATLNKGMMSLNDLVKHLASSTHGDTANYDDSMLTGLSRDMFGGNTLTAGIFCLRYDD